MESKVCSKCGEPKPLDEFRKSKGLPLGVRPECKTCAKEVERLWRLRNQAKLKEYNANYRQSNIEVIKEAKTAYYIKNKKKIIEKVVAYNKANPENAKERVTRFKARRPERYAQQKKKWALNNATQIKVKSHETYIEIGELIRIRNRRWAGLNRAKFRIYEQNYRAKKLGNGGIHTLSEWDSLKKKYEFSCLKCGIKEPQIKLTVDHILPIRWGGRNDIANIQPLCLPCNQSKNGKYADYRPDSKTYGEGWKWPSLWG